MGDIEENLQRLLEQQQHLQQHLDQQKPQKYRCLVKLPELEFRHLMVTDCSGQKFGISFRLQLIRIHNYQTLRNFVTLKVDLQEKQRMLFQVF